MNIRFTCRAVAFCGATLLFNCQAENTFVGKGVSMNKEVLSGTETQSDLMAIGPGTVHKTGAGTWQIPRNVLMSGSDGRIVVYDGQVNLTPGGTRPAVAEPSWLRSRAAMWLCVDNNVVSTADGVSAWYDVRETDTSAPSYMYGKPYDDYARNGTPAKTTFAGKNALYFGGYGSGVSLLYYNADGTRHTATDILHCYIVHAVTKNVGALFGVSTGGGGSGSSGDFLYHHTLYSADTTNNWTTGYFFQRTYDVDTQFYQNGVACLGSTTAPTRNAWELVDLTRVLKQERIDALFRQQNADKQCSYRSGGDYVAEVVLFSKRLTEPERVELESYLMRKWGIGMPCTPEIVLAENASVNVDVPSGENQLAGTYAGEGCVVKTGAGSMSDRAGGDTSVKSTPIALREGRVSYHGLVAMKAEAGRELSVISAEDRTAHVASIMPAETGAFVKSGSEAVEVSGIASNVTALKVSAGRLRVTGGAEIDSLVGLRNVAAPQEIALVNPSFETRPTDVSETSLSRTWYENTTDEEHLPGWRVKTSAWAESTGSAKFIWCREGTGVGLAINNVKPPDGTAFCAFYRTAQISQVVELPHAGRYEVTMWMTGQQTDYKLRFWVYLLDESAPDGSLKTNLIGQISAPMNGAYARIRGACDIQKAGNYRLVIETLSNSSVVSAVDDIHLVYIPDGKMRRWLVPNGNFENGSFSKSTEFNVGNVHPGWEFEAPEGYGLAWPAVTLAGFNMKRPDNLYRSAVVGTGQSTVGSSYMNPLFQLRRGPEGGVAALAFLTSGVARTTFVPPAGTWKLKSVCAGCFAATDAGDTLTAKVTAPNGVMQPLGSLSAFAGEGRPVERVWPTAFKSDGETPLTLELSFAPKALGQLTVDDLELYETVADAACTELVTDGGFEQTKSGTTTALPPACWQHLTEAFVPVTSYSTEGGQHRYAEWNRLSPDVWDGTGYMDLFAGQHVRQQVTVPEPGVYRLRFACHLRADGNFSGMREVSEPLHVTLVNAQGLTNFTASVANICCSNYVAHAYDVFLPAGELTLDFQAGEDSRSDAWVRENCLDGVSLTRAPKAVRDTAIPEAATVEVAAGAKLELAFTGTNTVSRIRLGGRYRSGLVTAETAPEYVSGPGALYAKPRGMLLIVR